MQADSGGAPPIPGTAGGAQSFKALGELFAHIGPIAIGVLVLLLFASLYSWTVILGKIGEFRRATKASRGFVRLFRSGNGLREIATRTGDFSASPLAQVYEDIYATYKRQTGGSGPPTNLAAIERSARTASSEAVSQMERRMTWLATIGSVSPFVGLFGTVMGIVDAFTGLGQVGTATLRAVAPGISEALITTAAGLFVAVPAVVAYNQFMARIRVFASAVDDFWREMMNTFEEIPARNAQSQRDPGPEISREVERGVYK